MDGWFNMIGVGLTACCHVWGGVATMFLIYLENMISRSFPSDPPFTQQRMAPCIHPFISVPFYRGSERMDVPAAGTFPRRSLTFSVKNERENLPVTVRLQSALIGQKRGEPFKVHLPLSGDLFIYQLRQMM